MLCFIPVSHVPPSLGTDCSIAGVIICFVFQAEWNLKLPFKSRQFEYLGQAKFPKYIDGLLNEFAQLPSCVDGGVL